MTGTPWTRADVTKTAVLVAVGALVWAVGWYRTAGKAALDEQIAPLNVAIVGFVVIGAGYAGWFLAGRRAVGARRRSMLTLAGDVQARATRTATIEGPGRYVGSERLFHSGDCGMAAGRTWAPVPRTEHERAGRVPCGLCAP